MSIEKQPRGALCSLRDGVQWEPGVEPREDENWNMGEKSREILHVPPLFSPLPPPHLPLISPFPLTLSLPSYTIVHS